MAIWDFAPSEFWSMSPQEFWSIAETRKPAQRVGNLPLDEFERLRAMLPPSKEGKP